MWGAGDPAKQGCRKWWGRAKQQCCGFHLAPDLDPPGWAAPPLWGPRAGHRVMGCVTCCERRGLPATHAQEPHSALSGASVSPGWAQAISKNRGLGCQLSSLHLPWALGVELGALTSVEEASLNFISCSSCPLEEGFCLLLPGSHADACLLKPQHWSATELALCLALTA